MSTKPLNINKHNFRLMDDYSLLFHVPSTALYEINKEDINLIKGLESKEKLDPSDINEETLDSLKRLNIIGNQEDSEYVEVKNFPANTLILNISTGCNLSCTYCYKADLTTLQNSGDMSFETAKEAIQNLYDNSSIHEVYTITYFGGEPLGNFSLIKEVTAYAQEFFKSKGAKVDFTLTTNGTLLTKEIVSFFKKNKFGITLSIDGPKAIHNKTRLTNTGNGTYDTVRKKASMLLQNYKDRPIGARVTLTAGITDVEVIWDHLFNELQFSEVGFAPATASDNAIFNLSEKELLKVFEGFKKLGDKYIEDAINNKFNGFSNLHRLIGDIHEGKKKSLPCGAGVGLLSVNYKGEYDLCHRFTGSDLKPFGTIKTGLDKPRLSNFIEKRLNNHSPDCKQCHIRNLCAGGCYHESYIRYNDPSHAVLHYCDIMRDWIEYGLIAYSKIKNANPEFFNRYFKNNVGDTNGLI